MLRNLSDEQYEDVMKVIGKMPYVDFQVRSEGECQHLISEQNFGKCSW